MSDFMGECVIGQGDQMEQVIEARDRFLKPNGIIVIIIKKKTIQINIFINLFINYCVGVFYIFFAYRINDT